MQVPVSLKLNNLAEVARLNENESGDKPSRFFQRTRDGKQILRDVMGRFIPEDIATAQKQGFSAPDASWFKGDSIDFVERALLDRKARSYDYSDYDTAAAAASSPAKVHVSSPTMSAVRSGIVAARCVSQSGMTGTRYPGRASSQTKESPPPWTQRFSSRSSSSSVSSSS